MAPQTGRPRTPVSLPLLWILPQAGPTARVWRGLEEGYRVPLQPITGWGWRSWGSGGRSEAPAPVRAAKSEADFSGTCGHPSRGGPQASLTNSCPVATQEMLSTLARAQPSASGAPASGTPASETSASGARASPGDE